MEIEALSAEESERMVATRKLAEFRSELDYYVSQAKRAQKARLIPCQDLESGHYNPADRLLEDNARLSQASDRLDRTQKMALEAEQIGATVLDNLRRQRDQIQRANRTLHETDADVDRSNRILKGMLRRYHIME